MRTALSVTGVFIGFLLLLPVCTQASDSFEDGKRLFEAGKYQQAYKVLEQSFHESPENLDISFFLGRAAFELGDYEMAAMAFERVLIMEPDAPRVKLELARTYLQLGSKEIARQYFRNVQATNPPEAVWQQIQNFLSSIEDSDQRHFFSGIVTMGLLYDDNVGVFPNSGTISINNLPFRLIGNKEEDAGAQATLILNHLYRIDETPYAWKTSLSSYNVLYDDQDEQNVNYYGVTTGPVLRDDDTLWELQALASQVDIDRDRYFSQLGLNLFCSHRLGQILFINLGTSFLDKTYFQNDSMDAETWNVRINPVIEYGRNRLSLELFKETENASHNMYSYDRVAAGLRYDRRLSYDIAAYGSLRYQTTDYDDEMSLFNLKRRDKQTNIELGLSKTVWRSEDHRQSLAVKISHSYTQVESNIALYEYDKNVTQTSLTFAF